MILLQNKTKIISMKPFTGVFFRILFFKLLFQTFKNDKFWENLKKKS